MKISKLIKSTKYLSLASEIFGIATSKLVYPERKIEIFPEEIAKDDDSDRIFFFPTDSDCVLIKSSCHYALLDCGKKSDVQNTISLLKKIACDEENHVSLDFILFNSLTEDNVESLDAILKDPDIWAQTVFINTIYPENLKEEDRVSADIRQSAINVCMTNCRNFKSVLPNEEFEFGSLTIEFLNSQPDNYHKNISQSDNSCAVCVKGNNKKVLILLGTVNTTGDIIRIADGCRKVDVLSLPRNGEEKLSENSLKLFSPKTIFVQNRLENLQKEIIGDLMLNSTANIYSASENGGLAVTFGEELKFNNNL